MQQTFHLEHGIVVDFPNLKKDLVSAKNIDVLCVTETHEWSDFRLRGVSCNITVVGVYIPQKSRTSPDQKSTYDKLEKLLQALSKQRDAIILMGDFNSGLKRNITGYTGRWCIHNRSDEGGERLLEIMRKFGLACSST